MEFRRIVVMSIVGVYFVGCQSPSPQRATRTVYDLPWRSLQIGMTADRVRQLFNAERRSVNANTTLTHWYYSTGLLSSCQVYFDSKTMTVAGWSEPR